MSFKSFLIESTNSTKVILQQLLDNLDDGHLSYDSSKIKINVGKIIKKNKLSNLYLVIINNNSEDLSVKLGKSKTNDSEYAIVVTKKGKMPSRKNIDGFISKNSDVYDGISRELENYLSRGEFSDGEDSTSYEQQKDYNNDDKFEEMYGKFTKLLDDSVNDYKMMSEKLKRKHDSTSNVSEKQKYNMAIKALQKDTIGDSYESFLKMAKNKFSECGNTKYLNSNYKKKLDSRMESYFEQNINGFFK